MGAADADRIVAAENRFGSQLHPTFRDALCDIARKQHVSIDELIAGIAQGGGEENLAANLRSYVVGFYSAPSRG